MSILDKAKGYADKAADAAAKATAAARTSSTTHAPEKKMHELYAEIGRLVVAQRRGGPDAEVEIASRESPQISAIEHELDDRRRDPAPRPGDGASEASA